MTPIEGLTQGFTCDTICYMNTMSSESQREHTRKRRNSEFKFDPKNKPRNKNSLSKIRTLGAYKRQKYLLTDDYDLD